LSPLLPALDLDAVYPSNERPIAACQVDCDNQILPALHDISCLHNTMLLAGKPASSA
jgi:hypothetical protein